MPGDPVFPLPTVNRMSDPQPSCPETYLSALGNRSGEPPIGSLMQKALAFPDLVSLAAGFVDPATLPAEETAAACAAILADPATARQALQYGSTFGHEGLRQVVLDRTRVLDCGAGPDADLRQVVLTPGSNQFLALVTQLACDPGDIVLCASPTYFVYLGLLQTLGVRAVGVDTDEDGLRPEALERTLASLTAAGERSRVKLIYVVPDCDNPCGRTTSVARREEILAVARRESLPGHPLYVLEDAAYRELRFDGPPLPSIRSFDRTGTTVLHAFTFSKSFSPGIRIGGGIVPRDWVDRLQGLKGNFDFGSPYFSQAIVAEVIRQGHFEPHLERLRSAYRIKRDAMLSALEAEFAGLEGVRWEAPAGGLYVWLTLPPEIDTGSEGKLFALALERGMIYVPGVYAFPEEGTPVRRNCIRLSYGVQGPERIGLGIRALAAAVRELLA